jgi:hypothetical protein
LGGLISERVAVRVDRVVAAGATRSVVRWTVGRGRAVWLVRWAVRSRTWGSHWAVRRVGWARWGGDTRSVCCPVGWARNRSWTRWRRWWRTGGYNNRRWARNRYWHWARYGGSARRTSRVSTSSSGIAQWVWSVSGGARRTRSSSGGWAGGASGRRARTGSGSRGRTRGVSRGARRTRSGLSWGARGASRR